MTEPEGQQQNDGELREFTDMEHPKIEEVKGEPDLRYLREYIGSHASHCSGCSKECHISEKVVLLQNEVETVNGRLHNLHSKLTLKERETEVLREKLQALEEKSTHENMMKSCSCSSGCIVQ